jgi:transcription elongation GreA/GreB family factor
MPKALRDSRKGPSPPPSQELHNAERAAAPQSEHRFLLTRERPVVTKVVAWAASNGDRSENADYQYGKRRVRTATLI